MAVELKGQARMTLLLPRPHAGATSHCPARVARQAIPRARTQQCAVFLQGGASSPLSRASPATPATAKHSVLDASSGVTARLASFPDANAPIMPATANKNQTNTTSNAADAERVSTPIDELTQPYMNQLHPHFDTAKLLVNVVLTSDLQTAVPSRPHRLDRDEWWNAKETLSKV